MNRKEDGSSRWDFKYVNLMWNFGDKCSQQYNKRDLAGSCVLKNIFHFWKEKKTNNLSGQGSTSHPYVSNANLKKKTSEM